MSENTQHVEVSKKNTKLYWFYIHMGKSKEPKCLFSGFLLCDANKIGKLQKSD